MLYLKFSMLVHILGPLSVQDELGFVGHAHDVILHGVAEESGGKREKHADSEGGDGK